MSKRVKSKFDRLIFHRIGKYMVKHMDEYLRPTSRIDSYNSDIKQKAEEITNGIENDVDKAIRLFYWVRDEIKYTPIAPLEIFEDYRASETLKRGKGFCVEKASLLAAFARAVGIPTRLHLADIRNHLVSESLMNVMGTNLFSPHGYCELHLEGKWVKATPAFDLTMCQENRIKPVEFDGKHDAIFHSHNLDGDLHIEYVKDRGHYPDVPIEDILTILQVTYGPETFERAKRYIEEEKGRGSLLRIHKRKDAYFPYI